MQLSWIVWLIMQMLKSFKLLCILLCFSFQTAQATNSISLVISDEIDVSIAIYSATNNRNKILLWLACNEGSEGTETRSATQLNKRGIDVWLPDFLTAHFLPQGPSSIYKIPGTEIAAVINEIVKQRPAADIYLVAAGRANAPLLRGAVEWEKNPDNKALKGMLMLYPRLNLLDPVPGNEPVYIEAVGKTRLPIIILEGARTPNRWGLPHLKKALEKNGSSVSFSILPKVRGYFYTRPKKTKAEEALSKKVHELILNNLSKLDAQ